MKIKPPLLMVIVLTILCATIVVIRISSIEDTYICVNHEWVAHGNPTGDPPIDGCQ